MGKSRKFGARRRREMAQAALRSGPEAPRDVAAPGDAIHVDPPAEQSPAEVAAGDAAAPSINEAMESGGEPGFVCNTLDPFRMAAVDDEDDMPFDAPDFAEDPLGVGPFEVDEAEEAGPVLLDRPAPTQLTPVRPPPLATPSAADKSRFMERARQLAIAQGAGRGRLPALRGSNRIAVLVAAGLAVPALVGVWALQSGEAGPSPAAAAVQTPTPSPTPAPDFDADYQAARALIESGNAAQGLPLLERAAAGGVAPAQYELAQRYERGDGVERDAARAREWIQRAAESGHCRAMHDVGVYLAQGAGAEPDEAAAFRWFLRAAEHGVADSQYNLGVLYQQGRGVPENLGEALFWYLVAARQHDMDAIDRAVEVAAQLSLRDVALVRTRARAFEPRPASVAVSASEGCAEPV